MSCFFCKGDLIDSTTVDVTDFGTCVVVIRGVPCQKCTQCGEIVINIQVGEQLENIVDELKASVSEVVILQYANAVA